MFLSCLSGALCAAVFTGFAHGQLVWDDPVPVNADAAGDAGVDFDFAPDFATDDMGRWIAVWENRAVDSDPAFSAIGFARSLDNGKTWSAEGRIDANPRNGTEGEPVIAYGGGTWMAGWTAPETAKGASDDDVWAARSTDGGETWSAPLRIPTDGAVDGFADGDLRLASDGAGSWAAAWTRTDGSAFPRIHVSVSVDDGESWPTSVPFASSTAQPSVVSFGGGVWIVVCRAGGGVGRPQIHFSRTDDNGLSWTALAPISQDDAMAPEFSHGEPDVAVDGNGNGIAVWMVRQRSINGGIPTTDPYYARSVDGGLTWSVQAPLAANPTALQSDGSAVSIATDGEDNWTALWRTTKDFGGPDTSNTNLYYVRSVDDGRTWSAPALVNTQWETNGTVDETQPVIRADARGTWLAGFAALNSNFGTPPNTVDWDIFAAQGAEVGYLRGLVRRVGTGAPIGSAAVRVVSASLGVERIAVTDRLGAYTVPNLPEGAYTIEVYAASIDGGDTATASDSMEIARGFVTKKNFDLTPEPLVDAVRGTVFGEVAPGSSVNRVPLVGVRIEAFDLDIIKGEEEPEPFAITFSAGDGTYAINGEEDKGIPVTVRVNFDAAGYVPDDRLPAIPPGGVAESNPTLVQKDIGFAATLEGIVVEDPSDTPIEGALVELDGPVRVSRVTQAGGVYVFEALPPATYTVRASAPGYVTPSSLSAYPKAIPSALTSFSTPSPTKRPRPPTSTATARSTRSTFSS